MALFESLLRRLFSGLFERRSPKRRAASVDARFRILSGKRTSSYTPAVTRDLSESGLGIETRSVRVDGLHVYDSMDMVTPTRLEIELDLPSGKVRFMGETMRYDATGQATYLLGVRVVDMAAEDRQRYRAFLESLQRKN